MPTAFTIGVRAKRFSVPTGPGQFTSMGFRGEAAMSVIVGGSGNNDLAYNAGLIDWRGDVAALTTSAGAAVSSATSGQGFSGTAFSNGNAANQATHSLALGALTFSAASASDANGDFYAVPLIRDRYVSQGTALGVVYFLLRSVGSVPAWDTTLMRVGNNTGTFTRQWAQGYGLAWLGNGGTLRIYREGTPSSTSLLADLGGFAANEDIALAWVINDSRSSGGVGGPSDNISRLFAKTKPGGSRPAMGSTQTAGTTAPNPGSSCLADLGRSRWNNFSSNAGSANGIRLHALGFDANPPITDAGIENNLDKLLARL